MSPQIATVRASTGPLLRRIVRASSSAWVGARGLPSPAVDDEQSTLRPKSHRDRTAWGGSTRMSGWHGVERDGGIDSVIAFAHR